MFAVRPTYSVQVGWSQYHRGLFTFGYSQFGGSDVLAADNWSTAFGGPYDDVTQPGDGSLVTRISIRRGRSDDLSTIDGSTCTFEVLDPRGRYDRKNTASPLYGLIDDNLHPVRVTATYAGVTYPLYYGFVRSIEATPGRRSGTATFECVDFFYLLNEISPVIGAMTNTTTGAVIAAILDYMQWRDPAMRSLAIGDSIPLFNEAVAGQTTALQLISDLLASERGLFFVNGRGANVYMSRQMRQQQLSIGSLVNSMEQLTTGHDADGVVNRWTVTREDPLGGPSGVPQVASDALSSQKWQFRDGTLSSPYIKDDATALQLAQYLVVRTKKATQPIWSMSYRPNKDAALMPLALSWEVGNRITVTESRLGTTGDFFIEQLQHEIDQGTSHTVSYVLTEVPSPGPFIFGRSTFGGADVLTY